jgi:hypothetical protein
MYHGYVGMRQDEIVRPRANLKGASQANAVRVVARGASRRTMSRVESRQGLVGGGAPNYGTVLQTHRKFHIPSDFVVTS